MRLDDFREYGKLAARAYADAPIMALVSGSAVIFCWDVWTCWNEDQLAAFKDGVHEVFPGCQFLLSSNTCQGHVNGT